MCHAQKVRAKSCCNQQFDPRVLGHILLHCPHHRVVTATLVTALFVDVLYASAFLCRRLVADPPPHGSQYPISSGSVPLVERKYLVICNVPLAVGRPQGIFPLKQSMWIQILMRHRYRRDHSLLRLRANGAKYEPLLLV